MTPPRSIFRLVWALHRALFRVTGGRVGTKRADAGLGTLFLRTIGRKSGVVRRTGIFYIEDGVNFVVVASNAGGDSDPHWWLNLQAAPDAEVGLAGRTIPVRARAASATESDALWPRLVAANPDFATYRAKVTRDIPVVILEPR